MSPGDGIALLTVLPARGTTYFITYNRQGHTMFNFQQHITPAIQSHIEHSMAFFNDLSKTVLDSYKDIAALNTQLAKAAFEDVVQSGHNVATARQPAEALSAGAALAQPAAERLRSYQQDLAQVAANTQSNLTKVAEQHIPDMSKSAREVAQEMVRTAQEQAEQAQQRQREALDRTSRQSGEAGVRNDRRASDVREAGRAAAEMAGAGDSARADMRETLPDDDEQALAGGAQAGANAAAAAAAAARRQQPSGGGARKS